MLKFQDKVVVITGASSGIGQAAAILFCKQGANLVLNGRDERKLDETIRECRNVNINVEIVKVAGDLYNDEICKRIVDEAVKKFQRIDILVNNAAFARLHSIENINLEEYEKIMKVNLTSAILLTNLSLPYIIKQKGNIVNVSSVAGTRSYPGYLAYCISKAALDQFTKCIALELADKGVRVNSVNPGAVLTNFVKAMGYGDELYNQFLETTKRTHPLGRAGSSEEIARSIVFLASDDASFITGELLHVDGGTNVMCPQ